LSHDVNLGALYNAGPKIRGHSPKNMGANNMQNFGRFYKTSDFDYEYLQNGSRYPNRKANFPDRFLLRFMKKVR